MMNIAFVNSTKKWGGVKTWCINTASVLNLNRGHALLIGKDPRFIQRAQQLKIDAYLKRFGFDYNPLLIHFFYQLYKKHKITCVIVNVGKDVKSAGIAARIANIPVIHRIGSPGDIENTLENRFLHKIIHPALICCSNFTKQGLLRNLPYLSNYTVTTIHPGVHIPTDTLQTQQKPTFITTSQLNADKRHIDLIEGCKILTDNGFDFSLKIVGEGNQEASLKQRVRELNLERFIHFIGYTNNVREQLQKADFFVLPSQCEPLGIALEEAMANGLIPIARAAGGVPEIWPPFLQHLLLPPDSRAKEFAHALMKLMQLSEPETLSLKQRIRTHAKSTFCVQIQAHRVFDFIASLTTNNKPATILNKK